MKKNKFILFAICLLCFFGFKLNAKSYTSKILNYLDFSNTSTLDIYNNYNLSNFNEQFQTYYNSVKNTYPYYLIAVRPGTNSNTIKINYYLFTVDPNLRYMSAYLTSNNNIIYRINNRDVFNFNFVTQSFDNISTNNNLIYNFNAHTQTQLNQNSWTNTYLEFLGAGNDFIVDNSVYTVPFQRGTYSSFFVYDANFEIWKRNFNTSGYEDMDLKFNNNYYEYNTVVPTFLDVVNLSPTVSLSNLTPIKDNFNNIIKYYVDVSFSVYDTNNYIYQYCFDNECQDILSNNINLELYRNGFYVFQILDNNNNLIDSTSLTISNINVTAPFIDYTLSVPDSCVAYIDNVSRNTCKSLKMEWGTSNPNYIYQYSVNNLDFDNIYGSYSLLLVQNDTVVMRVIDNDNNVLWSNTLTINDLYTIDSSLGIFTTFNQTNFGKNESVSNYLEVYIYNLDLSYIDNVYISYDGFNFSKLDVFNRGTFFYGLSKSLYSSQQVYINIKNNNNEIIYSTSYYVDMSQVANKGLLSYLENFNLSMNGPISSFVTTPLRFFQNILNNSSVCSPLVLPTRIGNLSLPCMKTVYSSISIDLYNLIETIFSGILVYYCGLSIIKTLKSLVSPTDDRIEVVDL